MRRLLHILTRADQALATEMIQLEREQPGCEVEVVELTDPEPDYKELLEKIFAADSVQIW